MRSQFPCQISRAEII